MQSVTDDIENFRFNVAVARGYELVNAIAKLKSDDAAQAWHPEGLVPRRAVRRLSDGVPPRRALSADRRCP